MPNPLYPDEPSSSLGNDEGDKKAKTAVDYSKGGDHCGICQFYIEGDEGSGTCMKVQGEIGEDMWCRLFKRKDS